MSELSDLKKLVDSIGAPGDGCLDNLKSDGTLEGDSKKELNALQQAFKDRATKEKDRARLATDSEYWFCVCFQSREQKESFLKTMQWFEHGDKYLDGQWVAEKLNVKLPKVIFAARENRTARKGKGR